MTMNTDAVIEELCWIYRIIISFFKLFLRNLKCVQSDRSTCLVGKIAVVTGGNKGIGYATSVLLASRGCRVIMACRSDDASAARDKIIETTGNPNIEIRKLDLTSFRSVRKFADNLKRTEIKIDILVNNAGISDSNQKITEDRLDPVMMTNYYGPFLLTHLLLDLLKASTKARVVFVSSSSIHFNRLTINCLEKVYESLGSWDLFQRYSKSKVCGLIATQIFAEKLGTKNILVNAADPGIVRTAIYDMVYEMHRAKWKRIFIELFFLLSSVDIFNGAQSIIQLATSNENDGITGQLFLQCEPLKKPRICDNRLFCEKVWTKSEELVHLTPDEKLK